MNSQNNSPAKIEKLKNATKFAQQRVAMISTKKCNKEVALH
ncbi:hypothetical protein GARC_5347 [Paraglaciecola arctica BSs20135]|uniref:Uncharacterized protein n=1 Tax=Paraglaciecola arctica BSs20135 TaxID=493475 RepID=K6YVT8_9ALTE|nr:hypothetical protein GARC_5347 [Paraglaciecola arctica BSs20135]